MVGCTVEFDTGCITCPQIPVELGRPGGLVVTPDFGWNAGANSVATLDGDIRLRFTVAQASALVVGLRREIDGRDGQHQPGRIRRGWRVRTIAGVVVADVLEVGISRTMPAPLAPCDVLEIQRVGNACHYLINGVPKLRTLNTYNIGGNPLNGPVFVTACLYASSDGVGPSHCPVDA